MRLSDNAVTILKSLGGLAALMLLVKLGIIKTFNFNVDGEKLLPNLTPPEEDNNGNVDKNPDFNPN